MSTPLRLAMPPRLATLLVLLLPSRRYTIHSLGNAAELSASCGGVEVLLVTMMVWFAFWQGTRMKGLARKIITLDTSAANYTVMVGRMPEHTREGDDLTAFFGQWGDVVRCCGALVPDPRTPALATPAPHLSAAPPSQVHCAVVYNYRDLILASRHRAACREALHHRQVPQPRCRALLRPHRCC